MLRILIVDDEEPIRTLLQQMLATKGYDCVLADGAAAARRHLQSGPFDLVISDLNMPGESGLDLLQYVVLEYPQAATMMITGTHDPGATQKALDMGVRSCLHKPFQFKELLESVADVLEERPGQGRLQGTAQVASAALKGALRNIKQGSGRRSKRKLLATRWSFAGSHLYGSSS